MLCALLVGVSLQREALKPRGKLKTYTIDVAKTLGGQNIALTEAHSAPPSAAVAKSNETQAGKSKIPPEAERSRAHAIGQQNRSAAPVTAAPVTAASPSASLSAPPSTSHVTAAPVIAPPASVISASTGPAMTCASKVQCKVQDVSFKSGQIVVNVSIHSAQGGSCWGCAFDVKLVSRDSKIVMFGTVASISDSGLQAKFRPGTVHVEAVWINSLNLYVALIAVNDADSALPVPTHCLTYSAHGVTMSRDKVIDYTCTKAPYQRVGVLKVPPEVLKAAPGEGEALCQLYTGHGAWNIGDYSTHGIADSYQWKEDGCMTSSLSADAFIKAASHQGQERIAFVGDSVMRNLFWDFLLFLTKKTNSSPAGRLHHQIPQF